MSGNPPLDTDEFEHLYELYHKNLPPLVSEPTLAPEGSSTGSPEPKYKTYRRAATVPLAEIADSDFTNQLQKRASYTPPTEHRPISNTELSTLLAYSYGEIREEGGDPRRPVASGGACYPLEIYPIVLESPDVDCGIYHYNIRDNVLEQLQEGDYSEWVRTTWTWITAEDAVAAVFVITAIPARSADKYGEMGYLFAGLEAGAVIQNLQLVATDLGIGSRPHNGLNYRELRRQLRLADDEYLLSTVAFGGTAPVDDD
jgi:SagB-type dehydrogenase family enzyme